MLRETGPKDGVLIFGVFYFLFLDKYQFTTHMFCGFQYLVHQVFFCPRVIPKVLILGQSRTSISQTVKSAVN